MQPRGSSCDSGAWEGRFAGEALQQDKTQCVHVRWRPGFCASSLLRTQIVGGADDQTSLGQPGRVRHPGYPEIGKFDALKVRSVGEQHVARLHIPMHDPALMDERQGLRKGSTDLPQLSLTQRTSRQPIGQCRPADELHHQERSILVGIDPCIEDGDQAGMIQARQELGLVLPALRVGIRAGPRRKDLHRDRTAQDTVLRQIHLRHAASAQQSLQAIPTREDTALPQRRGHGPLLGLHAHAVLVTENRRLKPLGHADGPPVTSPSSPPGRVHERRGAQVI